MQKIRTIPPENLFFVNTGHHLERRNWEDCRKHGYVAAGVPPGERPKLRDQLEKLTTEATIVAYISKKTPSTRVGYKKNGYVGIGKVEATSVPFRDFQPPLTRADLKGKELDHDKDDNDKCEHLVKVRWFVTVGKDDARWQKGLYSNQNIVSQCHDERMLEKTLHFLEQQFGVKIKLEKNGRPTPKKVAVKRFKRKRKSIGLVIKDLPNRSGFGYKYPTKATVRNANAIEAKLLEDYNAWLGRQGRRLRVIEFGKLCCDAFEENRRNLIEAKSSTERENIRMAVGELLDYAFLAFKRFDTLNKAILLPTKPAAEIGKWLQQLEISIIWREGKRFKDNANGKFA